LPPFSARGCVSQVSFLYNTGQPYAAVAVPLVCVPVGVIRVVAHLESPLEVSRGEQC